MNPLPRRLKKEPLIEVIWQAQFDDGQTFGDVLPGILFNELRNTGRTLQLHRLPSADIPPSVAWTDPYLRFAPKLLMEQCEGPFVWQVGDRVVTLNCRKPYVGWDSFKETLSQLTEIMERSQITPCPQRHSLRYIDLLGKELPAGLAALRINLSLGDRAIQGHVQMRLEVPDDRCHHVIQIDTEAQASLDGKSLTGTLIDLETLPVEPPGNWDTLRQQLDLLHDRSKQLFFQQILKEETIHSLEPEV